ncbi:unnamed protein product [Didymodactylos carnosus]|uniref:LEM domain-containing protein n=1 Tax=Didymodactylos carnosus TaxID=1234261 RepID=A0A815FEN9_9BILA|nr:unnamed protein product [Didymodactylos carnosus]CAF4175021.1 unnamed protein product [Didymodactylos carnosus]
MSSKTELHRKLKEIGYEIGPYASKDTLEIVMRLHSQAVHKGINVSKLNDLDLRKNLKDYNLTVGPVTNQTRPIYQRKLLELITNEIAEGNDDDMDVDFVQNSSTASSTPPKPVSSTTYSSSSNDILSPTNIPNADPRVQLTRINTDDNTGISPPYPKLPPKRDVTPPSFKTNLFSTNFRTSSTDSTVTSSPVKRYSPGDDYGNNNQDGLSNIPLKSSMRSTDGTTYGLRNPYNFQNDDYQPTTTYTSPFTYSGLESKSSNDTMTSNTSQYLPKLQFASTTHNTPRYDNFDDSDTNVIHRRTHEPATIIESRPSKYSSSQPKKVSFSDENIPGGKMNIPGEKSNKDKMDLVESAKDKGTVAVCYTVVLL